MWKILILKDFRNKVLKKLKIFCKLSEYFIEFDQYRDIV